MSIAKFNKFINLQQVEFYYGKTLIITLKWTNNLINKGGN